MPTSLRIKRRPKGQPTRKSSLTAASQPILDVAAEFRSTIGQRELSWQEIAWNMYDRVGELRYYVTWRAGSCSRVRLVASAVDPDTGKPTGTIDEDDPNGQRVQDIVRAIAGGPLGQAQLIRRAVEGLSIPGETWVGILDTGELDPDNQPVMTWCVLSKDEVRTTGGGNVEIELPKGGVHVYDPDVDSIIRIWVPYPRRAVEADSPVRATMDSLQEIVRTTKTIANASKSRLIGNGIVFVPDEMSLPATQGPVSDKTDIDAFEDVESVTGTPAVKQLQELLWTVASTAYDDEDSMAALIPVLATVPGEQIKNVVHLKFGNEVTQVAIQTRNDAITRLAMGLDVSPERLLGLGGSNHWSAWQISDEDVQLHIAPVMELICEALSTNVVSKILLAEGIDPRQYMLWYDATGLTNDPDKGDAATSAFINGAITAEAYRDYLGLDSGSGYDFDTMEGWQEWARDIVGRQPVLAPVFSPLLGPGKGGNLRLIISPTPGPNPAESEITAKPPLKSVGAPTQAPQKEPQTEQSSQKTARNNGRSTPPQQTATQVDVEFSLAERLLLTRALELAGKRRRTREDYTRLRDIPLHETHRYMPPVRGEEVPKLIAGWDSGLADDVVRMMGVDTEEMRTRVYAAVKRELTTQLVDES